MKKIKGLVKKYALLIALFVVVAIIVAGLFINKRIKEDIRSVESQIQSKYESVRQYERMGEDAPSPQLIGRLTSEKNMLEEHVVVLTESFATNYPVSYEFVLYPEIEFKEYLYFSSDRLRKKAERRNLQMPENLGFPMTGLVPEDQIGNLTLQFEVVKDIVSLIIDSGVSVIEEITYGAPQTVNFYEVLPLKITVTGTSNEILRCLKYFEQPSSYFVLVNFSIERTGRRMFRMDMGINGVILKREKKEAV